MVKRSSSASRRFSIPDDVAGLVARDADLYLLDVNDFASVVVGAVYRDPGLYRRLSAVLRESLAFQEELPFAASRLHVELGGV